MLHNFENSENGSLILLSITIKLRFQLDARHPISCTQKLTNYFHTEEVTLSALNEKVDIGTAGKKPYSRRISHK